MDPWPRVAYCFAMAVRASVRLTAAETVRGFGTRGAPAPNDAATSASTSATLRIVPSLAGCLLRILRILRVFRQLAEQDDGPGFDVKVLARAERPPALLDVHVVLDVVRVERDRPLLPPLRLGEHELDALGMRVEHEVETVVHDAASVIVAGRNRVAVEEEAERLGEARLPVLLRHLRSGRGEPADVADLAPADRPSLEPAAPAEHGMLGPEPNQIAHEAEKRAVGVLPVVPRGLVVLAVGVVVSVLRPPDLVAAGQHRHALRQEQRREEIALLPAAKAVHVRIVGRPFGAAVPRSVVSLAVATVFAVGLVVLLVVRHEVAEREAVVRGDEVD